MEEVCYSDVMQLFKVLLSYMLKISRRFVRKLIFNDLGADNSIRSCRDIVKAKNWKLLDLWKDVPPGYRVIHFLNTPLFKRALGVMPQRREVGFSFVGGAGNGRRGERRESRMLRAPLGGHQERAQI